MKSLMERSQNLAAAKKEAAIAKVPIVATPRREAPPHMPSASRYIKLHNVFDVRKVFVRKSAKIMSDPISFADDFEQQRALTEMQGVYCVGWPMQQGKTRVA
ncbi:hypothetical protein FKW77_003401 [Venturia effusa]|uniref:Uncharacterized protein n=1 Tax=Venturia effusa TaxID=50376 RepID=A0A517LGV6_9PEZI|nr:hypothetical protein FKW77_003401 [Venturia effusa]